MRELLQIVVEIGYQLRRREAVNRELKPAASRWRDGGRLETRQRGMHQCEGSNVAWDATGILDGDPSTC
jgi:hypothetical protein